MENHHINLAMQVLPLGIEKAEAIRIIDVAIETIAQSDLRYEVSPFETVIEGAYDEVMQLLTRVQENCAKAGATELIINMKLQRNFSKNVAIEDKMEKYRHAENKPSNA